MTGIPLVLTVWGAFLAGFLFGAFWASPRRPQV